MAYANPAFGFLHAGRDAGVSGLSSTNAIHADFPLAFLIDDRGGDNLKFNAAAVDHALVVNRGAAGLDAIDRLYIPSGHTFAGGNITVEADDAADFVGSTTILASTAVPAGAFDQALTETQLQYLRLNCPTSPSTAWELPELRFTNKREITIGPAPDWVDYYISNAEFFPKPSGVRATLVTGPQLRHMEFTYEGAGFPTAADNTTLLAFIQAVGTTVPFLFWTPFDTLPVMMQMDEDPRRIFDYPAPKSGTESYEYRFSMTEHIA